jgi:hypothetical protein
MIAAVLTSRVRTAALLLAALCAAHSLALAAAPPIEHFYAHPVFSNAALSPNAKFLAVKFGSEKQRDRLAVVDLVNNTVKVVASASDADIDSFVWVNDKRLVFTTADKRVATGEQQYGPGLFGVDRDGGISCRWSPPVRSPPIAS